MRTSRRVFHSLVVRQSASVSDADWRRVVAALAGDNPELEEVRLWEEDLRQLPPDDERARRLLAREARRALASGGPRLRITQLRYDGAASIVLVADRAAYSYEALRYMAGVLTAGTADSADIARHMPPGPGPGPGDPAQFANLEWGLPDPQSAASKGELAWAITDLNHLEPQTLTAAIALVLARYSGSATAELSLIDGDTNGVEGRTDLVLEIEEDESAGTFLDRVRLLRNSRTITTTGHPRPPVGLITLEQEPGFDYLPCLSPLFPLTLFATFAAGRPIAGGCWFDESVVSQEMARQFIRHVGQAGIRLATAAPDQKLSSVELITDDEATHLLAAGKTPARRGSAPKAIHDAFRAVAARNPERLALSDGQVALTYSELDAESDQRALGLHGIGVRQGDLVGVCLEPTTELVVTLLAVLKAGAAYVPLDPRNPPDRLQRIAEDADFRLVVTDSEQIFASGDLKVVTPQEVTRHSSVPVDISALPAPTADAAAYVIYTSGSTGRPKGVVVPHRNVHALVEAVGDFGLCAQDVWTLFHLASFDFSVWELWGCLLTGGRLVVVPYLVTRSPGEFLALLATERVTVLSQTPSAMSNLIEADGRSGMELILRLVVLGGESLDVRMLGRWFERHPPAVCRVVNMYGITETTVHVTSRTITQADVLARSRAVGRALPGWSVSVRDPRGRLLPAGIPGEIYVGGAGVANGYLGKDELTAQRFVTDPVDGGRVYRSGDAGRLRPDGSLDHLGRLDDQVKIRGFRIELGEIESVLRSDPAVGAAVVVLDEHAADPYGASIVAYVILRNGTTTSQVRRRAARFLPGYMVPATITALSSLPLTANGKLDVARLAELASASCALLDDADSAPDHASARPDPADLPTAMLRVWRRVLRAPVSPDDDFFDIGGNSLLAVRLVAALQDAGLATVTVRELYVNRSVTELANALERRRANVC